ncbi:molybdenum cofactor biosynthesis protein MoaE [Marinagarivorans algicola]|uniref:molybdenum cofactor biosynthesis protein MoaE n=1 Tax=Marinagarivorans algicola TaxID=1513270 RepID=UPI0006B5DBD1|nr:molybdenum cofactor biosynthesis protein MoaE [Marinagarivorans algicola]
MINITIQTHDFCQNTLYEQLRGHRQTGAIVTFTGLVREFAGEHAMQLEHYPTMTQAVLNTIAEQATEQWQLQAATIVHRVGRLTPCEQIVFVGVASNHRQAAFDACHYMIDLLKTRAPFWKKEGAHWVEAKTTDQEAAKRWLEANS